MWTKSIIVLGAALALAAPASGGSKVLFPLMAWDYATDEATLEKMADCGINMVCFVPPKMLDACEKHGLKAIVFDERIAGTRWDAPFDYQRATTKLPEVIREVNAHPAVYGYHLKDEPGAHEYPALAKVAEVVKKLAPGKWPYINLLPGDGAAYDDYVEQFCTICKPPILSYDRYVLGEDGKFGDGFWTNIATIRSAGIKHSIPFWNIVLTAPHWSYRELSAADIRLQVFGSLVYGARGISYYKFSSESLPILEAPDLGNFRMGPLDQFGEKTVTWEWLRNTNRMVLNLAPTLVKLRSDDVYHVGPMPERNHPPSDKTLVKAVPSGEFVVGDFTHEDGARYVMVVNKSITRSSPCNPEFNGSVRKLEYVSPITGETKAYPTPYYWLAPGQGVLLKVTLAAPR